MLPISARVPVIIRQRATVEEWVHGRTPPGLELNHPPTALGVFWGATASQRTKVGFEPSPNCVGGILESHGVSAYVGWN